MGAAGDFPIDLVILGGVALFLILRLRSILGRREGFERPTEAPGADPRVREAATMRPVEGAGTPAPASSRILPDPATEAGQALAAMRAIDPSFRPDQFLDGAEGAFRLIVAAFAAGDRVGLRCPMTRIARLKPPFLAGKPPVRRSAPISAPFRRLASNRRRCMTKPPVSPCALCPIR